MSKNLEDFKNDFKEYHKQQALDDLKRIIEKPINKDILLTIFAKIRIVLEEDPCKQNSFKCLSSYVNLVLHNSINRKTSIDHFKEYIDSNITKISEAFSSTNTNEVIKLFSSFFKMSDLKNDINDFFKKYTINVVLGDNNWLGLRNIIIQSLLYKMIEINSDKEIKVDNNIFFVKSFVFHIYPEKGIIFLGDNRCIGCTVFFENNERKVISITSKFLNQR